MKYLQIAIIVGIFTQTPEVSKRPVYQEFQTIVSIGLDECYWQDNTTAPASESSLDSYLLCLETFLAEARLTGIKPHDVSREDITKANDGNAVEKEKP